MSQPTIDASAGVPGSATPSTPPPGPPPPAKVRTTSLLQHATLGQRMRQYVVLAFFTAVMLGPILWLIASAFKTNAQILSGSWFIPSPVNLQGFIDAFTIGNLHVFFFNSILISSSATLLVLVVASLAAYPLARHDFPFSRTLTAMFSLGIVVPITSMIVPLSLVVRNIGLHDSRLGLILVYAALHFPLSFLILRAYFMNIPREVEEAGMVDGASFFTVLRWVVLPLSTPGLSTVAVVVFVFTWNEFLFALVLTSSTENRTVQVAIRFFTSQFDFNLPGMFATVTIVMAVPIIIFVLLQERVISGLTTGATKQ